MGSVFDTIVCPQCGREEAFKDYYYNTGEKYIGCLLCGYSKVHRYQTEDNGAWIMQQDLYEIDGKTVGYSRLKDIGGYPDLSDFVPFTQDVTQEELDFVEKKGYRIVKLDNAEKYGIKYLSFWFCRRIEKRDGKTYLRHVHPVVEDIEHTGTGICCFVSCEGNKTYYYLEDVDLAETLEQMKAPEYCENSYITKAEGEKIEFLFGNKRW